MINICVCGVGNVRIPNIIGVNRPAFGGTVPHFHQMSREMSRCPAFLYNGIIIFYVADYLHYALERNKVTNKAWFILRTPTDAVYISRVAAITSDCLFFHAAPPAASTLLP